MGDYNFNGEMGARFKLSSAVYVLLVSNIGALYILRMGGLLFQIGKSCTTCTVLLHVYSSFLGCNWWYSECTMVMSPSTLGFVSKVLLITMNWSIIDIHSIVFIIPLRFLKRTFGKLTKLRRFPLVALRHSPVHPSRNESFDLASPIMFSVSSVFDVFNREALLMTFDFGSLRTNDLG
jgi:hypothetical protein